MKTRPILFSAPMVRAILDGRKVQTRRAVKARKYTSLKHAAPRIDNDGRPYLLCNLIGDIGVDWVYCPYGAVGDTLWAKETWANVHPLQIAEGRYSQPSPAGIPGPPGVQYQTIYRADGEYPPIWHSNAGYPYRALTTDDPFEREHYPKGTEYGWESPIFMPRDHSRITLEVTDVRVERLGDITEADAEAEGVCAVQLEWWQGFMRNDDGSRHMAEGGSGDTPPEGMEAAEKQTYSTSARERYQILWNEINGRKHPWNDEMFVWVLTFKRVADRRDAATEE